MSIERVAIIGGGRVGLSLARALARSGRAVAVLGRHAAALPAPLEPATAIWEPAIAAAKLVLIAVPDDAIGEVAVALSRGGAVGVSHVVLHTSGLHDRSALAALYSSHAGLGSWHPLQTFARPRGEPEALAGSPVVIEGDQHALASGRELAALLHLRPVVEIAADQKALYHAAAVMASNYLVVLSEMATRLTRTAAGEPVPDTFFLPLMRRVLTHLGDGPGAALTGPVARGDAGTVARHLAALPEPEREVYLALARETLQLAKRSGLNAKAAAAIEEVLRRP
ncbi:MAG TPA: Rossmann-like and DUF2520 domain-containing protein [Gemmatimonadales bacterium]